MRNILGSVRTSTNTVAALLLSTYIRNAILLSRAEVAKFLNKLEAAARYTTSFFSIGLDGFDAAACKIECFNFTGYLLFGRKRKLRRNTESIGRVPTRGVFTVWTKSETADYLHIGSRPTSHSHRFKVPSVLICSCFSSRFASPASLSSYSRDL